MPCIFWTNSPLLVYADTFLHEGVFVGIEQEVELPPGGHGNQESPYQEFLCCAVASYVLYKPLHICSEVFHICHSG